MTTITPRIRRAATPATAAATTSFALVGAVALLGACDVNFKGSSAAKKQDTTVVTPSADSARAAGARDSARSAAVGGVPAVPGDSAAALAASAAADSGALQLYPTQPRRGGVLFAFAPGVATAAPRCTWKGEPLPCYRIGGGVLVTVPLPADDPAGTYTLTVDRPAGRIVRQVAVADRDFGRELVFLDAPHYALIRRGADVARDARAVRGVLSAETPDRQWSGRWKEPLPSGRSTNYGVDRFYYPASDSSRAISLGSGMRTRGAFGTDTTGDDASSAKGGDVPGWRHAGIDIPAARGAAVVAPAAGTVAEVGDYVLTGKTLLIDHGQGAFSAYFHLDTVLVRKGDRVRVGRTLARVGDTGLATGPHLHYGLYLHGRDVDPGAWRDMPPFVLGDSSAVASRR